MKIGETTCKSILNKSGISGVEYAINPYVGCGHACVYCYAKFMTRWYHKGEKWGSFVDVKKNAVECLKKEVTKKRPGIVLLSSVTDPYQPAEKKYGVTRKILECLMNTGFPVEILTKSSLILRDMDIIDELPEVEVGLTITCMEDKIRRVFEPGASTVQDRLDALKTFNDAGIQTYAFLGPLLPYVSEDGLEELMNTLADRVNRVIVDRLNIKAGNWKPIQIALEKNFPELIPEFKEASRDDSEYYDEVRRKMRVGFDKRAIPADIVF
ncbi:MAG: radical SAM protein [Candidatus Bathyarchaeota archaeon]|nr:radical SAM protein [Candidatus Bathyarchaeota archaeon]